MIWSEFPSALEINCTFSFNLDCSVTPFPKASLTLILDSCCQAENKAICFPLPTPKRRGGGETHWYSIRFVCLEVPGSIPGMPTYKKKLGSW